MQATSSIRCLRHAEHHTENLLALSFKSRQTFEVPGVQMPMACHISSLAFDPFIQGSNFRSLSVNSMAKFNHPSRRSRQGKLPKNLRYPPRNKLPPDFGVNLFLKDPVAKNKYYGSSDEVEYQEQADEEDEGNGVVWDPDELEAISSLFQGRVPQKPGKLNRVRPLPLPLPHKLRPLGLPTPKKHIKMVGFSHTSVSKHVHKNPRFLIDIAREIKELALDNDVSLVLNKRLQFLRKGSLSLVIHELGHMGLPQRALQTFCWAQKQPHLFPDDRILASTIQVLARHHELKLTFELDKFAAETSKNVMEAMVKGFIKGGWLSLARKLLMIAKNHKRTLDPSVYAKMILELSKNPDKNHLVSAFLDELKEREDFDLTHQDCTAVMKVCVKIQRFEVVESLFNWFRQTGKEPTVVMYTTIIHSRYSEKKFREAMAAVWEMEALNILLDLPAYRVAIKLFVALNDLQRAVRYYSKLKEAGFSPSYDIYRDMIRVYMASGRMAKCREVCREVEAAGLKLDKDVSSRLLHLEEHTSFG